MAFEFSFGLRGSLDRIKVVRRVLTGICATDKPCLEKMLLEKRPLHGLSVVALRPLGGGVGGTFSIAFLGFS